MAKKNFSKATIEVAEAVQELIQAAEAVLEDAEKAGGSWLVNAEAMMSLDAAMRPFRGKWGNFWKRG